MDLPPGYETDEVLRLEANLDDLSPEITGATMEKLLRAGALDVWLTPIQMKKSRPGVLLSVLCEEPALAPLTDLIFTETSTFGLRVERVTRLKLERRFVQAQTPYGEVTIKQGLRQGRILQSAPEFESCRQLSEQTGVPLRAVYEAALRAVQNEG
jgi:uncharacterized protein (DUF111 family)